ncbi:MAG: T9SS type A sorting domain-containing protein [Muribaculaceae bacterium]|nr:T9SS type A sorting domain-containing protein [Muribaculaceae bacterium]
MTKADCAAQNPADYFDGEWHHIVCVRNAQAKSTSIYIDGELNSTNANVGTGAINFDPKELIWIGGDDEPTSGREHRTFEGAIDELSVYPFVMSAEDVAAAYQRLDPSAVEEIIAVSGDADFIVVDAMSGRTVKAAYGEAGMGITNGLEKGIYVLVIDNGTLRQSHKFIKK